MTSRGEPSPARHAATDAERTSLLGAGDAMMAIYRGTACNVSYVMGSAAGLIAAVVIWRSNLYGRTTATLGLIANTLGLIPSTAGVVGLTASIAFLVPYVVWLPLVARRLFQLARGAPLAPPQSRTKGASGDVGGLLARLRGVRYRQVPR